MSLPRETMIDLMAFADGELEGEARSRVLALLESNAEARAIVGELRRAQVGDWVRESTGERAAGADGIADSVMARVGAPLAPRTRERRVVRPRAWMAAGAVLLAAAAGIALYVRGIAPSAIATAPKESEPGGDPGSSEGAVASGVEVDEIEAPARGVSVFEIPAAEGAAAAGMARRPASVVVWIDDTPGGR